MNEIEELVQLARWAGTHPSRLVLGGEGAVGAMLPAGGIAISAAHTRLAKLGPEGIVKCHLEKARALIEALEVTPELEAEVLLDPSSPAPDADLTAFAELFAFDGIRYALHTQPIPVNQIVCSPRARQFSDRRNLPGEIEACGQSSLLVPFMPPGVALAKEIRRKLVLWRDRYKETPKLILIQNHGMIALGATPEEVQTVTEAAVKYAEIFVGAAMLGGPEFLKPNYITQIDAATKDSKG